MNYPQQDRQSIQPSKLAIVISVMVVVIGIVLSGYLVHRLNMSSPRPHRRVRYTRVSHRHAPIIHKFRGVFPSQLCGSYSVPIHESPDVLLYHVTSSAAYFQVFSSNAQEADRHEEIRDAKDNYRSNYRHLVHVLHGNLSTRAGRRHDLRIRYDHYFDKDIEHLRHQTPKKVILVKHRALDKAKATVFQDRFSWHNDYRSKRDMIRHAKAAVSRQEHPRDYETYILYPKRCNWHYGSHHQKTAYVDGDINSIKHGHNNHVVSTHTTRHVIIGPFILSGNRSLPSITLKRYYGFEFDAKTQRQLKRISHRWGAITPGKAEQLLAKNHIKYSEMGY